LPSVMWNWWILKKQFNFSFGFVFMVQTANHHKWRETYIALLKYP
jgi:hypothetical protein